MARPIDADAVLDRYYAEFDRQDICDGSQDRDWLMRCIEEAPTLTQPNEPLTLEELREMDGEPVYVVPANEFSELGGWCVISTSDCGDEYSAAYVPGVDCWCWRFDSYGEQWLAYRRPPEGEEDANA